MVNPGHQAVCRLAEGEVQGVSLTRTQEAVYLFSTVRRLSPFGNMNEATEQYEKADRKPGYTG